MTSRWRLDRTSNSPMTIMRDPVTGQIRAMLRQPETAAMGAFGTAEAQRFEVLFSRGSPKWRTSGAEEMHIAKISTKYPYLSPKDHMQSAIIQIGRFLADGRGIAEGQMRGNRRGRPMGESSANRKRRVAWVGPAAEVGPARVHSTAGSSTVAWIPSSASCSWCMRLRLTLLAGLPLLLDR